jgi:hypothetical protein
MELMLYVSSGVVLCILGFFRTNYNYDERIF